MIKELTCSLENHDAIVAVIVWQLDVQLPMHPVSITTDVVSSNLDTTLCDKVCQSLATGRWFSPGHPVSSTNKSDHHDITEMLLKVTLNTIKKNKILTNLEYLLISKRQVENQPEMCSHDRKKNKIKKQTNKQTNKQTKVLRTL